MGKITKIIIFVLLIFSSLSFLYPNLGNKSQNEKNFGRRKRRKNINRNISKEPITLQKIFKKLPTEYKYAQKEKTQYGFIVTGDIIPARSVNYIMTKLNDFTHPFKKTADLLKKTDIVLINLESPLIKNCP